MKTYIIAEGACNHLGSVSKAMDIISEAKSAGADAVKFQVYQTKLVNDIALHPFLDKCHLAVEQHGRLREHAVRIGIDYICSAFDVESVRQMADFGLRTLKIPSGQIHSTSFLNEAFKHDWNIIASTGMCEAEKVRDFIKFAFVQGYNLQRLSILHCVSGYPIQENECNLLAIKGLRLSPDIRIGYSDHCMNKITGACAVIMGAEIIEHHIKAYGELDSPDDVVSFDPKEFYDYVKNIRSAEKMIGNGQKTIAECETKTLFRRDYR